MSHEKPKKLDIAVCRAATRGQYVVTSGSKRVSVYQLTEGLHKNKWMATAEWDAGLYTDPLYTKRDAVKNAKAMITTALLPKSYS